MSHGFLPISKDMMITVDFDDYGEKELMKMFGGLEGLS